LGHLSSQGNLQDALASIPDAKEYKVLIFDPTISVRNRDEDDNPRLCDEASAAQQVILGSYESPGVLRQKSESDQNQTDRESFTLRSSSSAAPDSVAPYLEDVFSLDTTAGNPTSINDEQNWASSKVYLPVRFSTQQEFDIQVESADSLVSHVKGMITEYRSLEIILTFW
jgi:hypothetical protein